jgi:hypothetical protein
LELGGGAAGEIPARPAAGLAGEVAGKEVGFTLARLVTGVSAEMSPASFRRGAGRRRPRAAPMPVMLGRRRMFRGPARFTGYQGRSGGGCAVVESCGRRSSVCAQRWRGGGALMVTRERGACGFIRGRARRFAQHHFTDTYAAWARHGGVRARSTAATPLGGRRTVGSACPRRALRVAQGEWGRKGGAAPGVPRRADRRAKAGLGRRVRRRVERPSRRPRRDTAHVGARSSVPGAKRFGLALFH